MPNEQKLIRAIITPHQPPGGGPKRYHVGIQGPCFVRQRFYIRGPWCESTARRKAKALQHDLDSIPGYADRLLKVYTRQLLAGT